MVRASHSRQYEPRVSLLCSRRARKEMDASCQSSIVRGLAQRPAAKQKKKKLQAVGELLASIGRLLVSAEQVSCWKLLVSAVKLLVER